MHAIVLALMVVSRFFVDVRPHRIVDVGLPADRLSLTAIVETKGVRVVLANTTREAISLLAADQRLNLIREAKDAKGRWRPVECVPEVTCGNSYHSVMLAPGRAFTFRAPLYAGPLRTRMRFVLTNREDVILSNEFEGSVDPRQFEMGRKHCYELVDG